MLKAYSYIENDSLDQNIIDEPIYMAERKIISRFTAENPNQKNNTPCIFCNGETGRFDIIEGVYYQRCKTCYSIFAEVPDDVINRCKDFQPLIDFRNSNDYQNSASEKRDFIWNDFLFWLEYRLVRYIQKKSPLDIIDVRNHYMVFAEKIKKASFCGSYNSAETADVVLFLDQFRCLSSPMKTLSELRRMLKENGILIMNVRVGSGFDVLALKGHLYSIYPYETILLPSTDGLCNILDIAGFEIMEISTPGTLDIKHVLINKEKLDESDMFIHYLLYKSDNSILTEFQRFLQKSGMSSHARVIARKRPC